MFRKTIGCNTKAYNRVGKHVVSTGSNGFACVSLLRHAVKYFIWYYILTIQLPCGKAAPSNIMPTTGLPVAPKAVKDICTCINSKHTES